MKISLRYDIFKNQVPIQNGCPLHLIDFLYGIIKQPKAAHDCWDLYSTLPTQMSNLRNILLRCNVDTVIEEHINDPIINDYMTMYVISPFGDSRPYLGLLPPNNKSFINLMSEKAKELLQNRSIKLVIDYSAEGWDFQQARISELHILLNNEKIPLDNVYFISSNLLLEEKYQAWCEHNNIIKPINIITGPFFENESFNYYHDKKYREDIFQQPDMLNKRIRLKKFLCFNRRPHSHRHALVCLLSMENLLNDSFVSWPPNIDYTFENKEDFLWRNFEQLFPPSHSLYNQLMLESKKLEKISPLIIDQPTFFENFAYSYEHSAPYQDSYFSIITETIFCNQEVIFFSEKIWKPIANLHPFLLVATKGSLGKLRELGYKTFNPYIDESYDLIDNHADRMLAIVKEMKRLNNIQISELNDMYYDKIVPILIHNRDWFFNNQNQHICAPLQKLIN